MTGIAIDPDQLTHAAQGIDAATRQLGTHLSSLHATLTSANPWGSDEPGTIFGTLYGAVLGHALDAMGSHYEKLGGGADGLAGWAEDIGGTDVRAAQSVAAAGQGLGR